MQPRLCSPPKTLVQSTDHRVIGRAALIMMSAWRKRPPCKEKQNFLQKRCVTVFTAGEAQRLKFFSGTATASFQAKWPEKGTKKGIKTGTKRWLVVGLRGEFAAELVVNNEKLSPDLMCFWQR